MTTLRDGHPDRGVVVVGIDYSELSEGALRVAIGLAARGRGYEVHLVHVLAHESGGTAEERGGAAAKGASPLRLSAVESARSRLVELGARVGPSVESMTAHVRAGKPDVEIAQLASDLRADLILIGAHGRHGLVRFFGSMADSLVRNAPCPVLTFYARSVPLWEQIQPPCPECVAVQEATNRERLWCERHSQHHPHAHIYSQLPEGYGGGSQSFQSTEPGS